MASNLRDQAARRRMELNPLTTSLQVFPASHQTPASAISSTSLSAPFGPYSPVAYNTPVSSRGGYNPSQWTTSSSVNSDAASHPSSRISQEHEAPAPPPYSPPRTHFPASDDPQSTPPPAVYTSSAEPPSNLNYSSTNRPHVPYRPSPEPAANANANANFPPPPTGRSRAGSSDRSSIFHLSPFSRRSNATVGEPLRITTTVNNREQPPPVPRRLQMSTDGSHRGEDRNFQEAHTPHPNILPPSARRAVSTGSISSPTTARTPASALWPLNVPLPPPPPGPPPGQARSQSMSRTTDPMVAPPTRRPPMSTLETIPPSPAGWVNGLPVSLRRSNSPDRDLQTDTANVDSSMANESSQSTSESSSSSLARTRAVRGESRSIRERRSESRNGRSVPPEAFEQISNNPWAEAITPSDIVVPPSTALGRRPTITKSTPRSGRSTNYSETPRSQPTPQQASAKSSSESGSSSTPRNFNHGPRPDAPTPPFTPSAKPSYREPSPSPHPAKALPTPPPLSGRSLESPANARSNDNNTATSSKTAPRPPSRQSSRAGKMPQASPADQFAQSATERHQAFIKMEADAPTDSERVRIFAEFIVTESRLRRERYATAIDVMGSEILELTRDLFRPYTSRRDSSTSASVSRPDAWTPDSSSGQRSHRGSMAASRDNLDTPSEGMSSAPPSPIVQQDSSGWASFIPSLSPIPSMSVSEAPDGSDSRGRPSSRWWEVSQVGSDGVSSMRIERSKRESKYMGVPKELREALQYAGDQPSGSNAAPGSVGFAPDEYPPEKTNLEDLDTPLATPGQPTTPYSPPPFTPNPDHLDVSRLVTLPPPYPRHHPAVNNNHPDLASIRTVVTTLRDFTEIEATKARFLKDSTKMREEQALSAKKRRSLLRINIQREIESGSMSYATAASTEAEAATAENTIAKEASKAEFELFQSLVVAPLNNLLTERIDRASELFSQLRSKLFVDAQEANPNLTQEEGDEQPELLEKLTLLKWIFEAREHLHREVYDILSDRNDRYRDMVTAPYKLANNVEKVASATQFFADDALKRQSAFDAEILKRTEDFMDCIEENVVRGVEVQLSAFWDIAPSLSALVSAVPSSSLENFAIQIPYSEYEENPSYYEFPLKYLHSLLGHCGKSTYQFIESQINLLCLLHEVKIGVAKANCRVMAGQRVGEGEGREQVENEMKEVEREEERRLTDDLKEKVRCVEELWSEGLGTELEDVKARIVAFLEERGAEAEDENE